MSTLRYSGPHIELFCNTQPKIIPVQLELLITAQFLILYFKDIVSS